MGMFEDVTVPPVLYDCEVWLLNARSKKRIHVLEMKYLRTVTKVRWFGGVRNHRVTEMCRNWCRLLEKADQGCFSSLVMLKK